ncbi:hypothetical protein MRX96_037383, partial [Rhipicephalus microplus]
PEQHLHIAIAFTVLSDLQEELLLPSPDKTDSRLEPRCYRTYKENCCCPAQIRRIHASSPEYPASAVLARGRRGNAHICEDCLKCRRLKKGQRNENSTQFGSGACLSSTYILRLLLQCYRTYKKNCCCPAQIRRIHASSPEYPASAVLARGRRGNAHICEDWLKCRRLKKGQRNENSTQFGSGACLSSTYILRLLLQCYRTYKKNCGCPAQIRRIHASSPEYPASAVLARGRRGNTHICEDWLKCRRLK